MGFFFFFFHERGEGLVKGEAFTKHNPLANSSVFKYFVYITASCKMPLIHKYQEYRRNPYFFLGQMQAPAGVLAFTP